MADIPLYEEVEVKCVSCGKKIKVIKHKGSSDDNFLCQKCGFGGVGVSEDFEY